MITQVSILFLSLFAPVDPVVDDVRVDRESRELIEDTYVRSAEQGYCLFGRNEQSTVVVEKAVEVEDALKRGRYQIWFSCIPQLLGEFPQVLQSDYDFVGAVHSHPSGPAQLSEPDKKWYRWTSMFQDVHGIYNGSELNFY